MTTREETEKRRDELLRCIISASGIVKLVCGVGNNTACILLYNAIDAVKRSPLYRQRVKKLVNMTDEEYRSYERRLLYANTNRFFAVCDMGEEQKRAYTSSLSDSQYFEMWQGLNSAAYSECKPLLDSLSHKYYKMLCRHKCQYPQTVKECLLALTMLEIADKMYQSAIDSITIDSPITKKLADELFSSFSMAKVIKQWRMVVDAVSTGDESMSITDDEQHDIDLGLQQIEEIMFNVDTLFDAFQDTVHEYAEVFRTKGFQKKALKSVQLLRNATDINLQDYERK